MIAALASVVGSVDQRFLWGRFIPAGHVTIFYADSEVGKSLLAIGLALSITEGRPYLGHDVERGRVLLVDGEDGPFEVKRRATALARGMGLTNIPADLIYMQPGNRLETDAGRKELSEAVAATQPLLVIVDNLGSLFPSIEMNNEAAINTALWTLKRLGPAVLVIDHMTAKPSRGAYSRSGPLGSSFKRHGVRSALMLLRAAGGERVLLHTKSNLGRREEAFRVRITFDDAAGSIAIARTGGPRLDRSTPSLTAEDRVLMALRGHAAASAGDLANECRLSVQTVRNALSALKVAGLVNPVSRGSWRVAEASGLPS
jgi:AAA domain